MTLLTVGCTGPGAISSGPANTIEEQLLAEIALERGQYRTAVSQYLNVARRSRDIDYARRATELAWDYGFDAHALAAAELWVALQPEEPLAHDYRLRLATRFGRYDAALVSLEKALGPAEDRSDRDYVALANELLVAPHQGLQLFRRLEERYPDSPGIKRSVAELAAATGDLQLAIRAARQTLALRTDWGATRAWLARLLLASGDRSSAFEQMAFAQENNPGPEYELEFVRLLGDAGEFDSAFDRLDRIADRYPDEPAVAMVRAELLGQAGQSDAAAVLYRDQLAEGLCFRECQWRLGVLALNAGQYSDAIGYFRAVRAGVRQESAVLAESQAWQALGDSEAALAVLDDYAATMPKRRFAILLPKAALLAEIGRFEEAVEVTSEAKEYRPWSEDVWLAHGAALERAGETQKTLEAFRRAYELAPDSATTMNAYGYTLTLLTRRYDEARRLIEGALLQQPDNPAFIDSLGWVLYRQGHVAEARVELERAYAMYEDPEIAAHLAELLWYSGERERAIGVLDDAARKFPDSRAIVELGERLRD